MTSELKAKKSRAVLYEEAASPLRLKEITVDPPGEREVLVRVTGAGLCHSDLNALSGHTRYDLPLVMGHEGVGRVEATGSGVKTVKPGDRVVLSWAAFCGECYFCERGDTELCSTIAWPRGNGFLPGDVSRFKDADGSMIHHFSGVSSLSEYTVVYETGCVVIDDDIEDSVAATVGCSVVTGLGSVFNTADIEKGSTTCVVGAGSIGMMIIQGARIRGAEIIAVLEPDKSKWPMAKLLGATHIFDNSEATPFAEIDELTGNIGLDYVFDAVGVEKTIQDSVRLARRGGTIVLVGSPHPLMNAALPMVDFHLEKKLIGSLYGSSNPGIDIPRILDYYREGSLMLDELIFETFALSDINDAIAALSERGGKYLIEINGQDN
jgi:S-(hydroxymethyl)glutathione dehydrogenase/alcohol dehydrogenase